MLKLELWRSDKKKNPTIHSGLYIKQVIRGETLNKLISKILKSRFNRFSIADDRLKKGRGLRFVERGHPDNPHRSDNHTLETEIFRIDIDINERSDITTPEQCYKLLLEAHLGDAEIYIYPSMSNFENKEGKKSRFHGIALFKKKIGTGASLKARVMKLFGNAEDLIDYSLYDRHHHFVDSIGNMKQGAFFGSPNVKVKLPKVSKESVQKVSEVTSTMRISDLEADKFAPFAVGDKEVGSLYDVWEIAKNIGNDIRFDTVARGGNARGWAMSLNGSFISWHNDDESIKGKLSQTIIEVEEESEEDEDEDEPGSFLDLAGLIIKPVLPWSGRKYSMIPTGGGKSTGTQAALKTMIETTTKRVLVVLPDMKSCDEWCSILGKGSKVYRSVEIIMDDGESTYYHELSDRGIERKYDWQDQQVVFISHAKYVKMFGAEHLSRGAAVEMKDWFEHIIIDEKIDEYNTDVVTYDDVARISMFGSKQTQHPLFKWVGDFIRNNKDKTVKVTNDLRAEVSIMLDDDALKHLHKLQAFESLGRTRNREAAKWFEGHYVARDKKDGNTAPADILRSIKALFHSHDKITVSSTGRAMFATRKVLDPCRQVIILDATADLWLAHTGELIQYIEHNIVRRYDNVTCHSMKTQGTKRMAEIPDTNEPTLLVTRKVNAPAVAGKSTYQTYFGADRGTNAFRDAVAVAVLENPQYPGWLEELYELQYPGLGAHMIEALKIATLIQVANRGCCRTSINSLGHCANMTLFLPNIGRNLQYYLKKHMPGIKIGGDKVQIIKDLKLKSPCWSDVKDLKLFASSGAWRVFKSKHRL